MWGRRLCFSARATFKSYTFRKEKKRALRISRGKSAGAGAGTEPRRCIAEAFTVYVSLQSPATGGLVWG